MGVGVERSLYGSGSPEWEFMNTILPKDSSRLDYAIHSCFYWRILADFSPLYGFLRLESSTATAGGGGLAFCLFTFKTTVLIYFVSFYFLVKRLHVSIC